LLNEKPAGKSPAGGEKPVALMAHGIRLRQDRCALFLIFHRRDLICLVFLKQRLQLRFLGRGNGQRRRDD